VTFREKTAWIMCVALLLGGVFYGRVIVAGSRTLGEIMPPLIPVIVIYTVILIGIAIFGHIGAALISVKDATEPEDEREARIKVQAGHFSGYVLGAGVLASMGYYLVSYNGHSLFHLIFGTLMLAQFSEYAVQIILFRKEVGMAA